MISQHCWFQKTFFWVLCSFFCFLQTGFAGEVHVTKVVLIRMQNTWAADVWLSHIDEGSGHYANWIEVRYDDGTTLGKRLVRRDIVRPSKDNRLRMFYRLYFSTIPDNVDKIWFRGHCKVHSYGGETVEVDLRATKGDKYSVRKEKRDIYKLPDRKHPYEYLRNPNLRKDYLSTMNE